MNNAETLLCEAVCKVFEGLLEGFSIRGNWTVDGSFRGAAKTVGPKLDVSVKPRRYQAYSSPMAEFDVSLEGSYPAAADTTLHRTVEAYELAAGYLDACHRSLDPVRRDFTLAGFTPVGFRLGGNGDFDIDPENGRRFFTLQFTIKGRIS